MKVILMAAGRGTRISKYIGDIPKSMVDIGGTTLISHTIDMLNSNGITDISIIVGYKHKIIEEELKNKNVKIYYNPFFAVTNSLGSLYYAKQELKNDDIILGNADVFWQEDILNLLVEDQRDVVMLSDVRTIETGDYFFKTGKNEEIIEYGKELTLENRSCEYVGLAKIKKEYVSKFVNQFETMIENGEYGKWWENVLYSLVEKNPIYTLDVGNRFWAEVDFIEDYERIKKFYHNKKNNL